MPFDSMFKIMNVDKLNVKLVVKMFYVLELIFGEWVAGGVLEFCFVFRKFVSILTKGFSPGVALSCEL
jgi:hypothetical protein